MTRFQPVHSRTWASGVGVAIALLWGCATQPSPAVSDAPALQARLDALQTSRPEVPGFAIFVLDGDGTTRQAATGVAAPDGTALTTSTPVRIASNTKTFVAAAMLRLMEQGRIDLDAPLAGLISTAHRDLLMSDGYDPDAIRIRHLLMHTSGLGDHFGSDEFTDRVLQSPRHVWSRTEQLQLLVEIADPLGRPGAAFAYSDSGYLLLGEVIERLTGEPLPAAVRSLLRIDDLGLPSYAWDEVDPSPTRAHQWLDGVDAFDIHGSVDAFGGGGVIVSVADLAKFLRALFDGEVFDQAETLRLMIDAPGHPRESPYRIGLFARVFEGRQMVGHGGFWGTDAFVVPDAGIVVTTVSLAQNGARDLRKLALDVVADLIREAESAAGR